MSEKLDNYCRKIFSLLILSDEKYRFNELYRKLNKLHVKLSKPTLISHLGHLQELGFIVRIQEDTQNVTYDVNWEKFEDIKKSVGYKKRLFIFSRENKDAFKSLTSIEQLRLVYEILFLSEIIRVRICMTDILNPEKKAENHFFYLYMSRTLDIYRKWFLETFKQADEKIQKELIENVEGLGKSIWEDLFTSENDKTQ